MRYPIIILAFIAHFGLSAQQPTLTAIPGGTFIMGCTPGQTPCDADNAAHQVTLDSFYLSVYEVTQAQYLSVTGDNPSSNVGCDECPVENITWYDAVNYCNLLSQQANLTPAYYTSGLLTTIYAGVGEEIYWNTEANGYRLPTEAEWEYAARSAGTDDFFYSGSSNAATVAVFGSTNSQPTGTLAPNSLGLYDMSGNISEFVWDAYGDYPTELICNPLGPKPGAVRVLRGGDYQSAPSSLAVRASRTADTADSNTGFRICSFVNVAPELPDCVTDLISPVDGATDVSVLTDIEWQAVAETTGYRVSLGTAPGDTDIVDSETINSGTVYNPTDCLPGNTLIYVNITAFNANGDAVDCEEFSFTTLNDVPGMPDSPTGAAAVCIEDMTTYSVAPAADATGYEWTVTGGTVTNGQGTTDIEVTWTSAGGEVCVAAQNACGLSNPNCLTINPNNVSATPDTPVGQATATAGSTENYTVSAVTGADIYVWQVTGGTINSGQGTTAVNITWTSNGGEVCVNAENNCGTSPSACLEVESGLDCVTDLINPTNGATNISVTTNITWTAAAGASGYRISLGSTSGGTDITDNADLDNELSYTPTGCLPGNSLIYVNIIPYNVGGDAEECTEFTFTTTDVTTPEMVNLSAGTFEMGCITPDPNNCGIDESPSHITSVGNFAIGKYEITQCQWEALIPQHIPTYTVGEGGTHPIYLVSWYDAATYCNRLSAQAGLEAAYYFDAGYNSVFDSLTNNSTVIVPIFWKTDAVGYRLPTEAEWEYAARGANIATEQTLYSGSDNPDAVAWYQDNSGNMTQPVGTKDANASNLHDMSGNLWEWCWDRYSIDYYAQTEATDTNPLGSDTGNNRVIRGGSWGVTTTPIRVAERFDSPVGFRHDYIGFRVVMGALSQNNVSCVPDIITPTNGATDVAVTTNIEWQAATGASGYQLSLGTTPGGIEIVDNEDLGNVLIYNPNGCLLGNTLLYLNITAYNINGDAIGCSEFSFTTGDASPLLPDTPNGTMPVCVNDNGVYNTNTVADATGYTWTVTGGTITSGQGTTSINVTWTSAGGEVCVTADNTCSSSIQSCTTITGDTVPAIPSAPTGTSPVCINDNGTYNTTTVADATGYTWTVTGGTITSGQGTTSINVTWTSVGGEVCVTADNTCGSSAQSCTTITGDTVPAIPSAPTGTSPVCINDNANYTTNTVAAATGYTWTVTGGTITSGQGTTSINVTWTSAGGEVCVTADNTCGSSTQSCTTITGDTVPSIPSAPTGTSPVCINDNANYTTNIVAAATGYTWTVTGGTITSGQGTISINVTWTSAGGEVCVTADNACGSSLESCTTINGDAVPTTPDSPTGTNPVCINDNSTYNTNTVADATGYTWTVTGGTITSGQGTISINVTWTNAGGEVCVTADNTCGSSIQSCTTINGDAVPTTPDAPTGTAPVCINDNGTYNTNTVADATGYTWTVTDGTITSGQGTTSINVTWTSAGGEVCVTADNTCGSSIQSCTTINGDTVPAIPDAPTGTNPVCINDNGTYNTNTVADATAYTWTVTGGTITSGQGTTSINVTWTSAGGEVCVTADNTCGSSIQSCTTINGDAVPTTPDAPTGTNPVCINDNGVYNTNTVADATSYIWTVTGGTITSGQGTTSIDVTWITAGGEVCVTAENSCGSSIESCVTINGDAVPATPDAPTGTDPVCVNDNGVYNTNTVADATGYTWTVMGGTITSGQGTTSINVTWTSAGGEVCVSADNTCGSSGQSCIIINGDAVPATPDAPNGTDPVCAGDTGNYSVSPVSGAFIYTWAVMGGNISSGEGTTNVSIDWIEAGGEICVTADNACGASSQSCTTIGSELVPTTPDAPSGTDPVCAGDTGNYSVSPVSGAFIYTWTVMGGNISSGEGTTNISIDWIEAGGEICVTADNACGTSSQSCTIITSDITPVSPSTPTGTNPICANSTGSYSTTQVSGATGYAWAVTGGTITSGDGTTSINVNWTSAGGEVCVTAYNTCGSSSQTCTTINEDSTPNSPNTPAGSTTVASGDVESYTIPAVIGATSYNWTVTGGDITNGQGNTIAEVTWTSDGGEVCVNAENACGTSTNTCLNIDSGLSCVTIMTTPTNGATNVSVTTNIAWQAVTDATGYRISLGTTTGDTDIVNGEDLGNVLTYDPTNSFAGSTTIYVNITAYNTTGDATGCSEFSFTTADISIPEMVSIPAGTFQMGCTAEQTNCGDNESPVHTVNINAFEIGRYEVTQSQWEAIVSEYMPDYTEGTSSTHPVYDISWYDAVSYANRLSLQEGYTPAYYSDAVFNNSFDVIGAPNNTLIYWDTSADGYRLPTEAEWEYAARGGGDNSTQTIYSGSNTASDVAWYGGAGVNESQPVGEKQDNILGLYDMSGNVWEWCWDWNNSSYYATSPSNNPTGATEGVNRVIRGGSWFNFIGNSRVAYRFNGSSLPGARLWNQGFRLAKGAIATPPSCVPTLTTPTNGATNIDVNTNIEWQAVTDATGYRLSLGTTTGGTDIVNNEDLGNVLTYDPTNGFSCGTTIYVNITAYNTNGDGTGCSEFSFTTADTSIPEMVTVAAGTYEMGCTSEQTNCNSVENPVHTVSLNAFEIGKYELTQSQWESLVPEYIPNYVVGESDTNPVYSISWYDATTYANRLSIQQGYEPAYYSDAAFILVFDELLGSVTLPYPDTEIYWKEDANGYRLPTEAEWEYAARGGNGAIQTLYSGSNILDNVAWFVTNSGSNTHPVGEKQANTLGLHDMSGNVWEWCWDRYSDNYYNISPSNNPTGPAGVPYRTIRGGAYDFGTSPLRVSYRGGYVFPGRRYFTNGFRLCRTLQLLKIFNNQEIGINFLKYDL